MISAGSLVTSTALEEDQAYFAEVAKGDYFDDMIDLFSASFTIRKTHR
jgi:hypothetical protein